MRVRARNIWVRMTEHRLAGGDVLRSVINPNAEAVANAIQTARWGLLGQEQLLKV